MEAGSGTRGPRAGILAAVCLLAPLTLDARPKIDVVTLDNGDRITCEITGLNRGILNIKTDYIKGTVSVEWIHVREITASQRFELELDDGTRYFGTIAAEAEGGSMVVTSDQGSAALAYSKVVRISQIDEGFWERLDGTIDVGLSAKKANDERAYNLAATSSYRTRKYYFSSTLNSSLSERNDTVPSRRSDLSFSTNRDLGGTWFAGTAAKLETNQELGLDLRATLAAGAGRYLVQSNTTLLSWLTGLDGTSERYADVDHPTQNLEALLLLQYQLFLFSGKETDITTALSVNPSLSSFGRVRSSLQSKLNYEFVKDFYFSFQLLVDFDSAPPTDAERFDWQLSSSLGYAF